MSHYDVFLLDAMGVIYYGEGKIPGSENFIQKIKERKKQFFVLTNGASKTPEKMAQFYSSLGLHIPSEQIISSGSLINNWVKDQNLTGKKTYAIGPADSQNLVKNAGLVLVEAKNIHEASVFVILDQKSDNLLRDIDLMLTGIINKIDHQDELHLCLPNPDIYYNKSSTAFGITSGSIALIIERALNLRYGAAHPKFVRLGKPFSPIFDAAKSLYSSSARTIMIGDQLETDILGARDSGLESCLIGTGITDLKNAMEINQMIQPTYFMKSLK